MENWIPKLQEIFVIEKITPTGKELLKNLIKQIISERDKEFIELLEDNRKETMWADKEDQEVSDQGIDNFIEAIKRKLQTLNKTLS